MAYLDYASGEKVQGQANPNPANQVFSFQDANLLREKINFLKDLLDVLSSESTAQQISNRLDTLFKGPMWRLGGSEYLGPFGSIANLQAAHPAGNKDQYALVGTNPRVFYVWDTAGMTWINSGIQASGFGDMLKADYATSGRAGVVDTAGSVNIQDVNGAEVMRISSTVANGVVMYMQGITLSAGTASLFIYAVGASSSIAFNKTADNIVLTGANGIFLNGALRLGHYNSGNFPSPANTGAGDRLLVLDAQGDVTIKTLSMALDSLSDVDLTGATEGAILVRANNGYKLSTPAPIILLDPDIISSITGVTYTNNQGNIDVTTLDPGQKVNEGQRFVSGGYLYEVLAISGNNASIVRHELAPAAVGGGGGILKPVPIGVCSASVIENNSYQFTLLSDGNNFTTDAADKLGFFSLGMFTGDFSLKVKLTQVADQLINSGAGVMIRKDLAPDGIYSAVVSTRNAATQASGYASQRERTNKGGNATNVGGADNNDNFPDIFLHVVRTGSSITYAFGSDFNTFGATYATHTLGGAVYVGLVIYSGDGAEKQFDAEYYFV